jgi:hypothetical protein
MPTAKPSSLPSIILFILPLIYDLFPDAFNAAKAYPTFPGKYPAFFLCPFHCFFVAVVIFTTLKTVRRSFDLALHRILIIFLHDIRGDFTVVAAFAHNHPLSLVANGGIIIQAEKIYEKRMAHS